MPTDKNCQVCTAAWPLFWQICHIRRGKNGIVQMGCDNEKALFLSSKKVQRVRQKRKHTDILQVLCKIRKPIPIVMECN